MNKLNNFVFGTFVTSAKNYLNSCFSYTLLYNRSMKKILLLVAILFTQALSAQVYYGDSDFFCFAFNDMNPLSEFGCVRHYIGTKGESTFLIVSIQSYNKAVNISKNKNVRIDYSDGTFMKTKVHSSKVVTLSKPYAKKKFYTTLVEFPVEKEELCSKKKIRKIYIEKDNENIHLIEIGQLNALCLNKEFPEYFSVAEKRAQEDKTQKLLVASNYEMPQHIQQHVEEKYPNCSYSLIELDTVHLPLSQIVLLNYFVTDSREELAAKADEAQKAGQSYAQMLQHSTRELKEYKKELEMHQEEYENPQAARGDENDYQRAIIELNGYNGKETITLYTRVGEENFSTIDFRKEAENCRKSILEFEKLINRLREQQEQELGE